MTATTISLDTEEVFSSSKTVIVDQFGRPFSGLEEPTAEQRRAAWLNQIADEFIRLEKFMPKSFLPEEGENYPDWVRNVEREFANVMFPVAKVKTITTLTSGRMGGLLGHECAMAVWTMELFQEQLKSEEPQEILKVKALKTEDIEKAILTLDAMIEKWYPGMRRLAKLALASCVDQNYEEMRDFLLAFSDGFARKPKTFKVGDMGNPTFEIYLFMLTFWHLVDRLQSVSHLHDVLGKVLGTHRIGDKKRIEKICQRIGLHYRSAGRPKKK